jgi:nitrite reductase (NADH) large subunit
VCGAASSLFEAQRPAAPRAGDASVRRVVILGGGIAGVTAAEHARLASPPVALTLVSREREAPYYRLNLTRLLAGEVDEASLALHAARWYEEQRIELVSGEAASIERARRELVLASGRRLPYDRLVLANGAHPFVPPIGGVKREHVWSVRTLEDCRAILAAARGRRGARCACVGGGLLGLESAGALARAGLAVTVLEGFDWLLPRQLAEPAGRLLAARIEASGIAVRTGVRVEELVGDEMVRGVRLVGGETIAADLVILAAGVRPSSHLALQSGLEVRSGVVVDDRLFTSDAAILAAGDVAEHRGVVYGIWPTAYAQGVIAGANAAGGSLEFRGLPPSNRLKVVGVDLFSIGEFDPRDGSYDVVERAAGDSYLRFVIHDGALVGANLYGDTSLAGLTKEAVESARQLVAAGELLAAVPELRQYCDEAQGG